MNCQVISIVTPQKLVLNGLWFGGEKPKKAIVFLHGLTSSPFSHHELLTPLANEDTAVIFFGNRGQDVISKFHRLNKAKKTGYTSIFIGEAHEVFTDCVDDIQGVVNLLNARGITDITLVGHSTGCQKAIYYLSRPGKQKQVKRVVLLSPMNDYAYAKKFEKPEVLTKATEHAVRLVQEGRPHELLPVDVFPETLDAQRFLSLYTPESIENQVFPYFDNQNPKMLKSVRIPVLIVLAEKDEYKDRPTRLIAKWFEKKGRNRNSETVIIPNALHGLIGLEAQVVSRIVEWLSN